MNNTRRKRIKEAIKMLKEGLKLNDFDAIDYGRDIILDVLDEEQYSYDNIPESLQYSYRAEKLYEAIIALENSYETIEQITEVLFNKKEAEVKNNIEKAISILEEIL